MTSFEERPETARGRALFEMLISVHAAIRRDLEHAEALAAQALEGVPAEEIEDGLHELRRGGILWRLQVDCLRHCRFVHLHHNAEDGSFFSELRETNPEINPVIDRLQAEHRRVSDDLDGVETAARALAHDDSREARAAVVGSLNDLQENLLAHLEYEELSIESTVRRMRETASRLVPH
jgi:Hemerythrin HHE cation binding domain